MVSNEKNIWKYYRQWVQILKGISVALFLRQIIFHNFDIILLVLKQTGSGISATSRKLGSAFSDMGSQMKNKIMNNNQVKVKD